MLRPRARPAHPGAVSPEDGAHGGGHDAHRPGISPLALHGRYAGPGIGLPGRDAQVLHRVRRVSVAEHFGWRLRQGAVKRRSPASSPEIGNGPPTQAFTTARREMTLLPSGVSATIPARPDGQATRPDPDAPLASAELEAAGAGRLQAADRRASAPTRRPVFAVTVHAVGSGSATIPDHRCRSRACGAAGGGHERRPFPDCRKPSARAARQGGDPARSA